MLVGWGWKKRSEGGRSRGGRRLRDAMREESERRLARVSAMEPCRSTSSPPSILILMILSRFNNTIVYFRKIQSICLPFFPLIFSGSCCTL